MIAHWDGRALALDNVAPDGDASSMMQFEPDGADGQLLPDLVGINAAVETLLWPLEHLLCRTFHLSLSQMRLLDEHVLGQELEDQCGVEAEDWWLTWQATKADEGLTGVMFALSERERQNMSDHPLLAHCKTMLPDAWVRLQALLPEGIDPAAVLDADSEGLFVGVYRQGNWHGMRRINVSPQSQLEDIAEDIVRTLTAMGHGPEDATYGRMGESLSVHLLEKLGAWQGDLVADLPARAEASMAAANGVSLDQAPNFRRGTWSTSTAWLGQVAAWRRAAVLGVLAVLMSVGGSIYSLSGLQGQLDTVRAAIEESFHRGLPQEKVMLDPIAQLRAATGGSRGDVSSWLLIRQLQALGKLKKKMGNVTLRELLVSDQDVSLVGEVMDFAAVDTLRVLLANELKTEVRIDDTERDEGGKVSFRLSWS